MKKKLLSIILALSLVFTSFSSLTFVANAAAEGIKEVKITANEGVVTFDLTLPDDFKDNYYSTVFLLVYDFEGWVGDDLGTEEGVQTETTPSGYQQSSFTKYEYAWLDEWEYEDGEDPVTVLPSATTPALAYTEGEITPYYAYIWVDGYKTTDCLYTFSLDGSGNLAKTAMGKPTVALAGAGNETGGLKATITPNADDASMVENYIVKLFAAGADTTTATPIATETVTADGTNAVTATFGLDPTNKADYHANGQYFVVVKAIALSTADKGDVTSEPSANATPDKIQLSKPTAIVDSATDTTLILDTVAPEGNLATNLYEVHYACVADNDTPNTYTKLGNDWTITGLTAETPYDVYIKFVPTTDGEKFYAESAASEKADATTEATPTYTFTLTGTDTIDDATYGYDTVDTAIYTITNTGNQPLNFEATTNNLDFEVTVAATSVAGNNGTTTVTVKPKTGLNATEGADPHSATITVSAEDVNGGDRGSQTFNVTFAVAKADLGWAIGSVVGTNREYDGTTDAAFTGTPVLTTKNGDSLTIKAKDGAKGTFGDAAVGTGKTVTITADQFEVTGTKLSNYNALTGSITTTANIDARTVTFDYSSVVINDKDYDGKYDATIASGEIAISNKVGSEVVSIDMTKLTNRQFASKDASDEQIEVKATLAADALTGANKGNYKLPANLNLVIGSAKINRAEITVNWTGVDATNVTRPYNGKTDVTGVTGTPTYTGIADGENANGQLVTVSYVWADKIAGTKTINATASLNTAHAEAKNYTMTTATTTLYSTDGITKAQYTYDDELVKTVAIGTDITQTQEITGVTVNGVNGETATGKFTATGSKTSIAANDTETVEWTFVRDGGVDNNYETFKKNGTIKATSKTTKTVSFNVSQNITYGASYTATATIDGLTEGETKDFTVKFVKVENGGTETDMGTTKPTDAGNYKIVVELTDTAAASYELDGAVSQAFTIGKATQAAPTITKGIVDVNSFEITVPSGAKYVVTESSTAPATSAITQDGTGGTITISGKTANTTYYVYAYIPGDANHNDSAVANIEVTTLKTVPTAAIFGISGEYFYTGAVQRPTVIANVTGVGTITVNTTQTNASPENAPYDVEISVTEGNNYQAGTIVLPGAWTINKATPEVKDATQVTASGVAHGGKVAQSTLSGEFVNKHKTDVDVPGTFAWTVADPANTVVDANTEYDWTFTPEDTTNYIAVTGKSKISVGDDERVPEILGIYNLPNVDDYAYVSTGTLSVGDKVQIFSDDTLQTKIAEVEITAEDVTNGKVKAVLGTDILSADGGKVYTKIDGSVKDGEADYLKELYFTVSPSPVSIRKGSKATVTIAASDPSYTLAADSNVWALPADVTAVTLSDEANTSVVVNGVEVGGPYALSVTVKFNHPDADETTPIELNQTVNVSVINNIPTDGGGSSGSSSYTVTYDAGENGTLVGDKTERVSSGKKPAKVPEVTANEGYTFVGWSLTENGKVVNLDAQAIRKNTTFYAVYEEETDEKDENNGNGGETTGGGSGSTGGSGSVSVDGASSHDAYMIGYEDSTFRPDTNITRAEAATLFARLDSIDLDNTYASSFTDVNEGEWYTPYIGYMEQSGLIKGYEDGTYRPDAAITRAEFAAIASRFAKASAGSENVFSDVEDDFWAKDDILAAYASGWVSGYPDGTFKPLQAITRAEVVQITNAMLGRLIDASNLGSASYNTFSDVTEEHWAYYQIIEASNNHTYTKTGEKEIWVNR